MTVREQLCEWLATIPCDKEFTSEDARLGTGKKKVVGKHDQMRLEIHRMAERDKKIIKVGKIGQMFIYRKTTEYSAELFKQRIPVPPTPARLPRGVLGVIVHRLMF